VPGLILLAGQIITTVHRDSTQDDAFSTDSLLLADGRHRFGAEHRHSQIIGINAKCHSSGNFFLTLKSWRRAAKMVALLGTQAGYREK